jgi:acyl-CoA synthetase (AMP-forming)/AMP-acid ligase II
MGLVHPQARIVDAATGAITGGDALQAAVSFATQAYAEQPAGAVLALAPTTVETITRYAGALAAGRPIALLDPDLPAVTLHDLAARFAPALVTGVAPGDLPPEGYHPAALAGLGAVWVREATPVAVPHPDLALLLPTSGSTGNPKLVRLAGSAVLANAEAIATALGIDADQVAPTSLPLFYTYGLSVLNSHLVRGATVVLERQGLLQREFWAAVEAYGVRSLAAVPYQFEMLRRLRFDPAKYPRLRTLTQAGGRLRPELIADFHERITAVGGRMYVMYGQTEATARMTILPADRLAEKLGSVGPAVPGGSLAVRTETGDVVTAPGITGEVIYSGPNVMLGYAESAADLARGDDLGGTLATGDLGYLDDDGYLFITGRLKRIGKVFGVRVNLDDVERMLSDRGPVAAIGGDDRLVLYAEGADEETCLKLRAEVADRLGTHSSGVDVRSIDHLPLMSSGKIDYRALEGIT